MCEQRFVSVDLTQDKKINERKIDIIIMFSLVSIYYANKDLNYRNIQLVTLRV